MFNDILIPMTGTAGDEMALHWAIRLARSTEACLTALETICQPMPLVSPWGMDPGGYDGDLFAELCKEGARRAKALRARLAGEGIACKVEVIETPNLQPWQAVALRAFYADLVVIAGCLGDTAEADTTLAYVGGLLMSCGRPVLVVPENTRKPSPPERILVAWRATREATRALHDALPLLKGAAQVDVLALVMRDHGAHQGATREEADNLVAHLARHGITATSIAEHIGESAPSAALLDHARRIGSDLIVAGGYGHSRMREWMLGGMTRELLVGSTVPLLLSH